MNRAARSRPAVSSFRRSVSERECKKILCTAAGKGDLNKVKNIVRSNYSSCNATTCKLNEEQASNGHPCYRDECLIKAAEQAAASGHIKVVKFLFDAISPESRDQCCRVAGMATVKSQNRMNLLSYLVGQVDEPTLKDEICSEVARKLGRQGKLSKKLLQFLLEGIACSKVRDDCCKALEDCPTMQKQKLFLLSKMRDPMKRREFCEKNTSLAAKRGDLATLKQLSKAMPSDLSSRPEFFASRAEIAAAEGHQNVVEFLVKSITNRKLQRLCIARAARAAVRKGLVEVVKFLVRKFLQNEQAERENFFIEIAGEAAALDSPDMIRFLVHTMSNQMKKEELFQAAIPSAAASGKVKVVEFLLKTFAKSPNITAAIQSLNLDMVRQLLNSSDEKAEKKDAMYKLAAEQAMQHRMDIVPDFVKAISTPQKRDECCRTVIEFATKHSKYDAVIPVLECVSTDEVREQCWKTLIEQVAINDRTDVAEKLLQVNIDQAIVDLHCEKIAFIAIKKRHYELATLLIRSIKNVCRGQAVELTNLCSEAIPEDKITFIQQLLSLADDAKDGCHIDVIEFLLKKINNPVITDPWRLAAAGKALKKREWQFAISLLLAATNKDSGCDLILHNAPLRAQLAADAITGKNELLKQIFELLKTPQLLRILSASIFSGQVALAMTLIRHIGGETFDKPDSGSLSTILILAAEAGQYEIVEALLNVGAPPDGKDSSGRTALSRACAAGHVRAAKTLLERGADASCRDDLGLTCLEAAERSGHREVVRLLQQSSKGDRSPTAQQNNQEHTKVRQSPTTSHSSSTKDMSLELHSALNKAGFTQQRAGHQQALADFLQAIVRSITGDTWAWEMTGSYAEGWAYSFERINGRTAADSDIDWTVLVDGATFCLSKGRPCIQDANKLSIEQGHALVPTGQGSQPAITSGASGVRPTEDICCAFKSCCLLAADKIAKLTGASPECVHLVCATRPNKRDELRVSFSFQEKAIMRGLSTVQGQVFCIMKFVFKKLLPEKLQTTGLKTYHAKTLLFFLLEKHEISNEKYWQPENIFKIISEALGMMVEFIDSTSSKDECMPHFFMPDSPLYFKNAGIGGDFASTKASVRNELNDLRNDVKSICEEMMKRLKPLDDSGCFYFHPFTLLPLQRLSSQMEERLTLRDACDVYKIVRECLMALGREAHHTEELTKLLGLLQRRQCCRTAALCLTAMYHLKRQETYEAREVVKELIHHQPQSAWETGDIECLASWKHSDESDWAWRFCFPPSKEELKFSYLPNFTQSLITLRLAVVRSAHYYANFRCLSWSLQAELQGKSPAAVSSWLKSCDEDGDMEELFTLAHYSNDRSEVDDCLQKMRAIKMGNRTPMEHQDERRIEIVVEKLTSLSTRAPVCDSIPERAIVRSGMPPVEN